MIKKHDKLVRDKIPEIIKDQGDLAITHIADEDEYRQKLYEKLVEEVKEFLADDNIEELADILEVVSAILDLKGISREEMEELRSDKLELKGGFKKRIILDESGPKD